MNANKYKLPASLVTQKLTRQLEDLRVFAMAEVDPEGYRQGQPMRAITFDDRYIHYILRFLGWLIKYEVPTLVEKKAEALENNELLSEKDLKLEQQLFKRELEWQDITPLKAFAASLASGIPVNVAAQPLNKEWFKLDLSLMEDLELIKRFVAWGINGQKNSRVWARQVCDTAILISKKNHASESKKLEYCDINIIEEIRQYRKPLIQAYSPKTRETKDEKILTPQQMEGIIDYLWQCTAERYPGGTKRSNKAIIWSWQRFLIILFLHHYPIRSREIREMTWGRTLKLVKMGDGSEVFCCEMNADNTKTKQPKKWYLDPAIFNQPFEEWLNTWRLKAGVNHQFVFFMHGNNLYPETAGKPLSVSSLHSLVSGTIYAVCRDLRAIAKLEIANLMKQGKTEVEARGSLSDTHKLFIDVDPKRTNPHFLRHIGSTDIRRQNATPAEKKAFHKIIGNSEAEGDASYAVLELEEETEQAISWRKTTKDRLQAESGGGKLNTEPKNSEIDLSAVFGVLTPEQKSQLGLV